MIYLNKAFLIFDLAPRWTKRNVDSLSSVMLELIAKVLRVFEQIESSLTLIRSCQSPCLNLPETRQIVQSGVLFNPVLLHDLSSINATF